MSSEGILIALAAAWIWTNLVEPFSLRLRHRELFLPSLSPRWEGFTLLHLSDLHICKKGLLERRLLRLLKHARAEMAVLTGDMVDSQKGIAVLEEVFSVVQAPLGAFAVSGNAEHKSDRLPHPDQLEQALRRAGVCLLRNEKTLLTRGDATLWIAGVDDPHSGRAELEQVAPAERQADLHLLLAHSPDVLLHPLSGRFDLILCGHTHCGQVRLPGWGALWSHTRLGRWAGDPVLLPERIARRLNRPLPQPTVAVSPGVATVGSPLLKARLFCPPEVTLWTVRARASAPARTSAMASPARDSGPAPPCG